MKSLNVLIDAYGPAEQMKLREVDIAAPGPGQVRMRNTAIGFNFIDVYQRRGANALPLPAGLGHEAAGVVVDVGDGVTHLQPGDRVATATAGPGAYASIRNVDAAKVVPLPDDIGDEVAASILFKGLTAQYLVRKTRAVGAQDVVVVHAAAGGVGALLAGWAKGLGAKVIGVTSSPDKVAQIRASGADGVSVIGRDRLADVVTAVAGRKATVVYDSVGLATFEESADALEPFGLLVIYGSSSGATPPIDPEWLNRKGCLFLTRPSVFPHNATTTALLSNAADVFEAYRRGLVKVDAAARYRLADVVDAHRDAEAKKTTGSLLLMPE